MMNEVAAAASREQIVEPGPVKILLVDDRPENLTALEAVLESLGQHLVQAHSGREALRKLLDEDYACILLDVMMPDMDGFETAALIRERERSRNTPIIFLTALKSEEDLFRGYFMGAVDYLYKPIVPEVLRSKVAVFVELARKTEMLRLHAAELERANLELRNAIEERRRAEEEVRTLNTELEERVAHRTEELTRTAEELRQFAYVASHDLQEPLRTVGSYAQLLGRRFKGQLGEDADEFIGYIVEGVTRMHHLLNDMLAYSRLTDVSLRPLRPFSAETALDSAVMNLEATIHESGAEITHDELPAIVGDDVQITQVFQNLIGNSIKYRGTDAPKIHVSVEQRDSRWVFSVRDNGIGIEPKYQDRIFGIFKRLHGKELPGTGMGLAICKKVVERHGGQIWVDSTAGEGSTFHFSLPIRPSSLSHLPG